MESKVSRGGNFVDPEGYRKYITDREQAFRAELAKQRK